MGSQTVSIWLRWSSPGGKQPRHAAAYRNNHKNELLTFNAIVNGKTELHLNRVYIRFELNGKRV